MKYVEIIVDKKDFMVEDLCEDLNPKSYGLKQSSRGNELVFKGSVREDEYEHIMTLCAMSPYGNGYSVFSNGRKVW